MQATASVPGARGLTWLIAGAGLVGAGSASALPASGHLPEMAAVLVIGALALLAGHAWGLIVVVIADVVLLGRVWPILVRDWPPSLEVQLTTYAALLGALPGLLLLKRIMPLLIVELLGRPTSPQVHTASGYIGSLLAVIWLALPMF